MLRMVSEMKYITLNRTGKIQMPIIGLGTWRAQNEEIEKAVITALECGYRHIDTAFNYNNEEVIGKVLKKWFEMGQGKREDLFITTKLPNFGNRAEDVEKYLKMSLERLQLKYVDLYLIHMPFSFVCDANEFAPLKNEDGSFKLYNNDNIATWKVMEEQVKKGLTRSIGLSNFNVNQVKNVYSSAIIKPSVLQIELHAYLQQKELRKLCKELNIAVTAYAPLGSPSAQRHFSDKYNYPLSNVLNILSEPVVTQLAEKYKKTAGQILLRFLTQQNIIVIPKSGNSQRICENINIFDFELEDQDFKIIDSLDRSEKGRIFDFLFFKGVENHPEYPFIEEMQEKIQN